MTTQDRLKELFSYDPETGLFTRLVTRSHNAKAGQVVSGCKTPFGYRVIHVDGKVYMAHRLAWLYVYGDWPTEGMDIDHANRNREDNRLQNLRLATRSENLCNKVFSEKNTSGVTGVSWYKAYGRWNAQIHIKCKRINLGYFDDIDSAADARRDAELKYFGQYRRAD